MAQHPLIETANWFHFRPRFMFACEISSLTQQDVLSYSADVTVNAGIVLFAGVCLVISFFKLQRRVFSIFL
jgi:hypothetical protein